MKAYLILEDGTVFPGKRIGADRDVISEIVFNTTMAGYPEILTDPSYAGQAVCMTYPLIGNYGVCLDDLESERPWPDALIVRELARVPSNFRSDLSLGKFMERYDLPGIEGVDTRKLTRLLREKGTMNGMITSREITDMEELLPRLRAYSCGRVVERVSCREKYVLPGSRTLADNGPISGSAAFDGESYRQPDEEGAVRHERKPSLVRELTGQRDGAPLRIALMDFGTKRNIAQCLAARGCDVTIYPALTPAEELLADRPDGIMLSNGPGDPKECVSIIREVRKLYDSGLPIFAICLGHQLMALATGADTYKLKYGHRGGNHPVKDLETGRVYISSQNHGYAVDTASLDPAVAVPAFSNVNDGTNEGLRYVRKSIFTVQFHPEACAGPQDTEFMFDRFFTMVKERANNA
ncbi:carbamoyl phosphate synthase small subunit [Lachnoclostridium sp. Marseille-P6806]|uniref:carbamoyl phosphate synthase small subunit n=1 Tax=Lachnoclostridium sp. Marseille-P6806 TaxID=2364793 RepID=UPI00102FB440|nr:carbamoyl phosphate synthase small subunit [Lachnoclostridium sp. Marseille-P6806]